MSPLSSPTANHYLSDDSELFWPDLKQVISGSSGYKRWVLERGLDANAQGQTLDAGVLTYIRPVGGYGQ